MMGSKGAKSWLCLEDRLLTLGDELRWICQGPALSFYAKFTMSIHRDYIFKNKNRFMNPTWIILDGSLPELFMPILRVVQL